MAGGAGAVNLSDLGTFLSCIMKAHLFNIQIFPKL